ncbi:uncharacterized protein LOC132282345 [Cornus florida]|uniref:uncharacterized protein LOC132282345 n=1 Tax=Cornus florida TaxID=4283 RepID=UPI0028A2BF82|nr:uncharacterized protein LOC132282345 [Cornus florida]
MMTSDDDWVKAAMADDSIVVDLLVRLNDTVPPPPKGQQQQQQQQQQHFSSSLLPLDWTVRQRRSRTTIHPKKPTTAARASPTTPLSWSGGATSLSGGGCAADGFEESSQPTLKRSDATRSKVTATSETTTSKRSRKKKTLAELKEEETLLLKERKHLKRELATLRVTLEKQRVTNENLKRLKLDLPAQPVAKIVGAVATEGAISDQQVQQNVASCDSIPSILPPSVTGKALDALREPFSPPKSLSVVQEEVVEKESMFMLPDLNLPLEEDSSTTEVLHGIS